MLFSAIEAVKWIKSSLEGTWEEIAAHAEELAGKRLTVIVETEFVTAPTNFAMLQAMREADEIQQGMNPKPDSDGVAILREGRQGAMYGGVEGRS